MPINYGSTRVNDVFYGNKRVLQIYQGSNLVYNAEIGLPKGYVELEYIEATGTQWIDTEITPQANILRIVTKCQDTKDTPGGSYFGTVADPAPRNGFRIYNHSQDGSACLQTVTVKTLPTSLNDILDLDITVNNGESLSCLCNGTLYTEINNTINLTNLTSIVLCATRVGNSVSATIPCKFWGFKVQKEGKTVCNLIPVMRTSDGTVGMYDLHRRKFLTNSGTGKFIAGNFVLPKGYDELEYIESTGTQYIDTLYKPNNNTKFRIKYNMTSKRTETVANVPYGVTNIPPVVNMAGNGLFRTTNGSGSFNRVAWGDETTGSNSGDSLGNNHTIVYGNWCEDYYDQNEIYIDNDLVYTSTTNPLTVWNSTNNLYIFARNTQGHADFNSAMKLKSAYATENNLYKMYLKPARKISDGTIGMYDLINNKFLTNAGSDDFIIPTN